MPVPNTFANATATIPLSQLDANFATTITLGNTAIQLGNTVSTLNNMTLANVTVTSGNVTLTNVTVTTANVTNATITTANVTTANIATEVVTTSQTLSYGAANGIVYLNGSKVSTTGASLTFDGTNFATTGSVTSAGASNSGNLTFTGTGNRITGDFSNATTANRVIFQTSTVNGSCLISALPNGTGTISQWGLFSKSDIANSSVAQFKIEDNASLKIVSTSAGGTGATLPIVFELEGSEAMRVDTSGRVGIGTSSPLAPLQISTFGSLDGNGNQFYLANNYYFDPVDSRDESVKAGYSNRIVLDNASGGILFQTTSTSAAGANTAITLTERARITASGYFLVGTTSENPVNDNVPGIAFERDLGSGKFSRASNAVLDVNRKTNDGELVGFYQDGTKEGTISVSGTTVSYNGGHLSRWAQTADNTRIELLKGTVMSNLDQMSVWIDPKTGEPQANEQLNCMKVSDVEGDVNVAGVFVNWDNDDDVFANDMNVAMTGDMIIRIAQGVTVQRGDLLMSAGDGTAKPQGDDIIRSKTVAKVTSTHVTCTYEDGSYCVPCVLMAC